MTNVKVGDRVIVHCGVWDENDPLIKTGGDPIVAPSNKIWGYETNWGSFAQFTKVQAHQLPAEAAPPLVGIRRRVHARRRDGISHADALVTPQRSGERCGARLGW